MTRRAPEYRAADEALDRLTDKGFKVSASGRIYTKDANHVPTDEDMEDLSIVKRVYPSSQLVD